MGAAVCGSQDQFSCQSALAIWALKAATNQRAWPCSGQPTQRTCTQLSHAHLTSPGCCTLNVPKPRMGILVPLRSHTKSGSRRGAVAALAWASCAPWSTPPRGAGPSQVPVPACVCGRVSWLCFAATPPHVRLPQPPLGRVWAIQRAIHALQLKHPWFGLAMRHWHTLQHARPHNTRAPWGGCCAPPLAAARRPSPSPRRRTGSLRVGRSGGLGESGALLGRFAPGARMQGVHACACRLSAGPQPSSTPACVPASSRGARARGHCAPHAHAPRGVRTLRLVVAGEIGEGLALPGDGPVFGACR